MPSNNDERRHPSQETIDNTVAIGQLATISERTTKDVDRLVKHIEKFLPVHEKLSNLKKILYVAIATVVTFGIWITLNYFTLSTQMTVHSENEKIYHEEMKEKTNDNKNQITYLKGRIK